MKKFILLLTILFLTSTCYAWTTLPEDTSFVHKQDLPDGGVQWHIEFPCTANATAADSFLTWGIDIGDKYSSITLSYYLDTATAYVADGCSLKIGYEQSVFPAQKFVRPSGHSLIETLYEGFPDSAANTGVLTVKQIYPAPVRFIRFYVFPVTGHAITVGSKLHLYITVSKSSISFFRQGGVGRFSRSVFPSPSSSIEYYHIKLAPTGDTLWIEADVDAIVKMNYVEVDSVNILQGLDVGTINYAPEAQSDDAYEIALPQITALVAGLTVTFKANTLNTDGATFEITGIGDVDAILKLQDQALVTGDVEAGQIVTIVWDGSNWQMTSQVAQ